MITRWSPLSRKHILQPHNVLYCIFKKYGESPVGDTQLESPMTYTVASIPIPSGRSLRPVKNRGGFF